MEKVILLSRFMVEMNPNLKMRYKYRYIQLMVRSKFMIPSFIHHNSHCSCDARFALLATATHSLLSPDNRQGSPVISFLKYYNNFTTA